MAFVPLASGGLAVAVTNSGMNFTTAFMLLIKDDLGEIKCIIDRLDIHY